jgi:signal transduction histidine kinase
MTASGQSKLGRVYIILNHIFVLKAKNVLWNSMNHFFGFFSRSQKRGSVLRSMPRQRILLVMDGENNASTTENVLRDINADVTTAKNAGEARACCAKENFSLILCDVEMRSQEGLIIAQTVVQSELTRDTPIIFLNDISESDHLSFSTYKSAPIDCVSRPIASNRLISKVNVFLLLQTQRLALVRMGEEKLPGGSNVLSESATQNIISDVVRCSQRMDGITRFSAIVAHDYNNLLAIIVGNLELLGYEDIESPKVNTRIAAIQKAADRACALTNELLGISRRSAKQRVVTNANEAIESMNQLILAEVPPNVTLTLNLAESLWLTAIDPDDFQEAMLNLVLNACEAMPDGGQLSVETSNVTLDQDYCSLNPGVEVGDHVAVSVTDTGCGIMADAHPFVFEPFFSSKDEAKTTGMGLPQVYGFCLRSNGHIRLLSTPNVGTVARLCLPKASH